MGLPARLLKRAVEVDVPFSPLSAPPTPHKYVRSQCPNTRKDNPLVQAICRAQEPHNSRVEERNVAYTFSCLSPLCLGSLLSGMQDHKYVLLALLPALKLSFNHALCLVTGTPPFPTIRPHTTAPSATLNLYFSS